MGSLIKAGKIRSWGHFPRHLTLALALALALTQTLTPTLSLTLPYPYLSPGT
jgi:hypothetical protein